MATVFQVWGSLPPSVYAALTDRQRRALEKYIEKNIIQQCYRIAYDCGHEAGRKELPTKRAAE